MNILRGGAPEIDEASSQIVGLPVRTSEAASPSEAAVHCCQSCKSLGTQKAHRHKHFMGISLPCWVWGISLSSFLLTCFFGALKNNFVHRAQGLDVLGLYVLFFGSII